MNKNLLVLGAVSALFISSANAGEYMPYVGFDYVNMTPSVSDRMPGNYDIGSFNAGIKFVDLGSIEGFVERSMRAKEKVDGTVSRGRIYGYGGDLLVNAYNMSEGAVLASVGYGRISTKLKYDGHTEKADGNALRLGLGGELNPTPEWGLRAMYRYSLTDSDSYENSKEFSFGVRYYFY